MLKEINSSKDVITNVDLFNEIIELVKNSKDTALMKCEGELPPFVDYAIPESYVSGIYDYEFDPLFVLSPGYNEGYYLDLSIRGAWSITDKIDTLHLGTIKTLAESVEGIRQMAALYGECLVSFQKIMYDNMDSFTRKGFDLKFYNTKKEYSGGFSGLESSDIALQRFQEYHSKSPEELNYGIIRDNMSRKEKIVTERKVTYSDDEKKELSVDDVEIPDTIPLAAGNNDISVTYLGKEYTSTITAKQKTAAVVAAETYKTELDNSVSNVTTDSIFVSVQQKYTESGEYFLTHIIVNDPSSQVKGGLSNDSWGGYREYPTTYAGRTGAAVTTNGSYFSYDSGQPVCAGCFIKGGKILKDGVTNGKEICLDNTGKFYTPSAGISASTLLASGVKDIWGTADPLLIQDGQKVDLANQQKINNTYYNRTAIGMVQPGEYYMITAGTAQYKNGLSFAELQSIFANLGCTYARSMDGGGSSSLVVNGKLLNTPAQYDERPVVDFLSFLP